jgi:hypothetical protein
MVAIKWTSLLGVGHPRSDSVVLLMLYIVMCNDCGTSVVYWCLGTAPTLLRRGKISSKPYIRVMTYKTLVSPTLKYLGNCYRKYTTLLLTNQYFYGVLTKTTPLFKSLPKLHVYCCLHCLISYLIMRFTY